MPYLLCMSINVTKLVAVETAAFTSLSTRLPRSLNIQTEQKRTRNQLKRKTAVCFSRCSPLERPCPVSHHSVAPLNLIKCSLMAEYDKLKGQRPSVRWSATLQGFFCILAVSSLHVTSSNFYSLILPRFTPPSLSCC